MFGLGQKTTRNSRRPTAGPSKLRGALLAGAGLLAYRWWQNRQKAEPRGRGTGQSSSTWSSRPENGTAQPTGFAAGGTTPGGSAF